jgi:hypothetical protein
MRRFPFLNSRCPITGIGYINRPRILGFDGVEKRGAGGASVPSTIAPPAALAITRTLVAHATQRRMPRAAVFFTGVVGIELDCAASESACPVKHAGTVTSVTLHVNRKITFACGNSIGSGSKSENPPPRQNRKGESSEKRKKKKNQKKKKKLGGRKFEEEENAKAKRKLQYGCALKTRAYFRTTKRRKNRPVETGVQARFQAKGKNSGIRLRGKTAGNSYSVETSTA